MRRACAHRRSFAIDQVSSLLAVPIDYRPIPLSNEGQQSLFLPEDGALARVRSLGTRIYLVAVTELFWGKPGKYKIKSTAIAVINTLLY
jgi:hypothetical protein